MWTSAEIIQIFSLNCKKKMYVLEGSDTQIKFRIREVEWEKKSELNISEYEQILWIIEFNEEKKVELIWKIEENIVTFELFWEVTKGQSGNMKMDIWGMKGLKKVRFNAKTIKGKVLDSIKVPNGM